MIDTEALRTFIAVHRQKGFSGAARTLHRTQPAISTRIRLLEQDLGARLFERSASGIMLSQAGRVLLPRAEAIVAALGDAEQAVLDLRKEAAGPIDLVIVGTLADTNLTNVLKLFAERHPGVELNLRTARSMEVSELVRNGEATIGLRYDRDRSENLQYEQIGSDPMVIACAPAHRFGGKLMRSLKPLRDERWLAFPEIPGKREIPASHIWSIFLALGLGEIRWWPVDSLNAQKRLVEAGSGLALLPKSSLQEELSSGSLKIIRVAGLQVGQSVQMITRRDGFLSVATTKLMELLRAQYRT
jgi:DNA-binding transcriptional LysR family regulator